MKPNIPDPDDINARRLFLNMTPEQQRAELNRIKKEIRIYGITCIVKVFVFFLAGSIVGRALTHLI